MQRLLAPMRVLVLACGLAGQGARAEPAASALAMPPGQADTLVILHQALVAAAPGQIFTLDLREVSIAVTTPGGTVLSIYPDNLDLKLRAEPDAALRAVILQDHVAATLEAIAASIAGETLPETPDPASLMPVVRAAEGLPRGALAEMPHLPLAGGLIGYWVQDLPQATATLDHAGMHEAGLDPAGLARIGLDNLRARLPGLELEDSGPYRVLWLDGIYESSVMLLPEFWQAMPGAVVAAVPARDVLFFAEDADAALLAEMRGLAEDLHARAPYPVSADLFAWTDTGWVVVVPE